MLLVSGGKCAAGVRRQVYHRCQEASVTSRDEWPLGATQEPSESKCTVSVDKGTIFVKVENKISDKNKSYTIIVPTAVQKVKKVITGRSLTMLTVFTAAQNLTIKSSYWDKT